tara:strand:+ start:12777 stop:13103 length:327 start_codon:yes stop_codon:yes gene_type:complete
MSRGESCRFCGEPALVDQIEALQEELDRYRNGFKGSCYACEVVGELNVELEACVSILTQENTEVQDEVYRLEAENVKLKAELKKEAEFCAASGDTDRADGLFKILEQG